MRLTDDLRAEHVTIERVLGALRTWVSERLIGAADREDGAGFARFLRLYAGDFHHGREEQVLFAALAREAGLPTQRGPLLALHEQHAAMARMLAELAPLLQGPIESEAQRAALASLSRDYARALLRHIDAENSVLLPESEERLRRAGVFELPTPAADGEQEAARLEGERLAQRYPPSRDPEALRGEGCVVCPSYGTSCDGVEREWWSEDEWDEFPDHVG